MAKGEFDIGCVNITDSNYPYLLKQIIDPPPNLYFRGNYANFKWLSQKFLAIVGSRQPSDYGIKIAKNWSFELAKQQLILVSGLALGIDTLVHSACLKAKGLTIAVLGSPIDQIYPKQNEKLYFQIIKQGGLVVSEFSPGRKISRGQFVTRNRIITGLCQGVLLIEGTSRSGTLVSARYAGQQGREVLVLPGRVIDPLAEAPLIMLKQGATAVLSPQEIIDGL